MWLLSPVMCAHLALVIRTTTKMLGGGGQINKLAGECGGELSLAAVAAATAVDRWI